MKDQRKNPAPKKDNDNKADEESHQRKELGGRSGPEPTRYGDWENNGIASDF
ncbi:MAG: DUF1674 domain-containing protein [Emcibacter sp.]|nr:DUF1674 domain-containing protein [Emcibacter sp.]